MPGPQAETINRSILETAIQAAVSMVNNVPYSPIGDNHTLLSPADMVNPWRRHENQEEIEVQRTPPSNLESLRKAKHILTIKQDQMRHLLFEETKCQLNRFKSGRLKLGKNKNSPSLDPGCVVLSDVGGTHPQLGVVLATDGRDAEIRFRSSTRVLPVGHCTPIARGQENFKMNRVGEVFSHFVSLDFNSESPNHELFLARIKEIQDRIRGIQGIGKMVKGSALHITVGVLRATPEEIPALTDAIIEVWDEWLSMMGNPSCLAASFKGLSYGDLGCVWLEMTMAKEAVTVLREMMADKKGVGNLLTDLRFTTHLTIARSSTLDDEMKSGIRAAIGAIQPCVASIKSLSIRPRKVDKVIPDPILSINMEKE